MAQDNFVLSFVRWLVSVGPVVLLPILCMGFFFGVLARLLIFYHIKREEQYSREFEKRVDAFLIKTDPQVPLSFFGSVKKLLLVTYYEMFEKRALLQRRKSDPIMAFSDRVFLTKQGFAILVKDVLLNIRFLKYEGHDPKLLVVSKNVFERNPAFTRILGIFPSGVINDVLNVMPSMFVIGGIFGTFLGIMNALPRLGTIDLKDFEGAKMVLDVFLLEISHSMSASVVGIMLSVTMTIFNAAFSPQKVFIKTVERFQNSLQNLWNRCEDNVVHPTDLVFDEHKNPLEALAEQALNQEHLKAHKRWFNDPRVRTDEKKAG